MFQGLQMFRPTAGENLHLDLSVLQVFIWQLFFSMPFFIDEKINANKFIRQINRHFFVAAS
jgi:hypothetical protein